jgi:hypothetical protein
MTFEIPEKARLLKQLKEGNFNVPDFLYVPAQNFEKEDFEELEAFLAKHRESYKILARSAHPMEEFYRGGTFDSLQTYADIGGIKYARKRIIKMALTTRHLSVKRQQKFYHAPEIDPEATGIIVMPLIEGTSVMTKMIGDYWEFGYCKNQVGKLQNDPYITRTPHNIHLLEISKKIQDHLGFKCEIEYIIDESDQIHVVQAKDISHIEMLEQTEMERSVVLDGVRRYRIRRSYRERPIYVIDMRSFYLSVISGCENLEHGWGDKAWRIENVLAIIEDVENEMEKFALMHQRFGILGLSLKAPEELYQMANHYLDDTPEQQNRLSKALQNNIYMTDYFIAEADTLIAKEKIRFNFCSHDAYGIDTVRNPLWSIYWHANRHEEVVKRFRTLGFKTGDTVGIDIDKNCRPTVYRF